ncbi:MAG TPA: WD40 repeat domain-containing protein [Acidimicrobiia bacterium]|nr:WD40 repeat domain-containing protein [Acidimicrobiia bacterium]
MHGTFDNSAPGNAAWNNRLVIRDLASGHESDAYKSTDQYLAPVVWSPDGTQVVAGTRVIDMDQAHASHELTGRIAEPALAWTSNGVFAQTEKGLELFDPATGKSLGVFSNTTNVATIRDLAISNGQALAIGATGNEGSVMVLYAVGPDGRLTVVDDKDRVFRIQGATPPTTTGSAAGALPDGDAIMITNDGAIVTVNSQFQKIATILAAPADHNAAPTKLLQLVNGRTLYFARPPKTQGCPALDKLDLTTGTVTEVVDSSHDPLAVSPDGSQVVMTAACDPSNLSIVLRDVASGHDTVLGNGTLNPDDPASVGNSPDGSQFAVAYFSAHQVEVYDGQGKVVTTIAGSNSSITPISWTSAGLLVPDFSGTTTTIHEYDPATGKATGNLMTLPNASLRQLRVREVGGRSFVEYRTFDTDVPTVAEVPSLQVPSGLQGGAAPVDLIG